MATDLDFERSIYSHQQALPVSTVGSLFETYADRVLARVDEVLGGIHCPMPPTHHHKILLTGLRSHVGRDRAVSLAKVEQQMKLDPRKIKELVQELRLSFGVQIGALRSAGGGYYLISSDEESQESHDSLYSQAISMLRTAHALRPRQSVAELTNKIRFDLQKEVNNERRS